MSFSLPTLRALTLCLAVLAWSPLADAQQAPPPEYTRHVADALSEFELSHFEEAREQFKQAHAIFPNARTLRGLGMVEFELRHYSLSVGFLEQALASTAKPLADKLRSDTEALLGRARSYIGEVRLTVEPASATLSVDGVSVAGAGSRDLVLDVGDHMIELRAAGYLAQTHRVQVEGGMLQTLRIKLVAPSAQVADAPTQSDRAPDAPQATPLRRRWWLWTTIGIVVVGGAVTAALLIRRDSPNEGRALRTENTPAGATLFSLERAR